MSSTNSSYQYAQSLSISSKILKQMERIITIIKDLEHSKSEEELKRLNRLLYKATDNLMEFELSLHQLKVRLSTPVNKLIICMACGKPWPHTDLPSAFY